MVLNEIDNQRNTKYCSAFYQPNFKIKTNNSEDVLHSTSYETEFTSAISKNNIFM